MAKNTEYLDDLFKTFLSIKKAEGRADVTIQQYHIEYQNFIRYLDRVGVEATFENMTKPLFRDYINYMRDKAIKFEGNKYKKPESKTVGLSPSTINTRIKILRVIFNTLLEEEYITHNPLHGIKRVPDPQEKIEVLNEDELKRLFAAPKRDDYAGFRDYCLLHLLIDGMMRISESTKLKVSNFDFKNHTVTIPAKIAKGRRTRTLPLRPVTTRLVRRLIEANEEFHTEYVFLTNYGEPITRDHFRKRLYEHGEKAKIKKGVHPHLLRHTAATQFLESGGDMRHLQMLLGHSDLRMVMRYTHLSDKSLQQQHEKYSPINKVSSKLSRKRKTKL